MARVFIYDGREFPDPDPKLTVDEVRQHMATYFPELSNAEVKESKRPSTANPGETDDIVEFKRRVGTKG
jgi:PRTRC genetic system protein C